MGKGGRDIDPKDFRVKRGRAVHLDRWPTITKSLYLVEGRLSAAALRPRGDAEPPPASPLRSQPARPAGHLPGHGRCRQGRHHQARDVRRQSAGLPGLQLQTPERDGARSRLSLADDALPARARPHRHLQPLLLRRSADRAGAPGNPRSGGAPRRARRDGQALWEKRYGSILDFERHLHRNGTSREVLPAPFQGGAAKALSGSHRRSRQELEVQHGGRRGAQVLGRSTCVPTRSA